MAQTRSRSPDAVLVRCVERAIAAKIEATDLWCEQENLSPETKAKIKRLDRRAKELMERAVHLPAWTPEGQAAKVRLLAFGTPSDLGGRKWRDPNRKEWVLDRLIWSLHHDMRVAPIPPH